MPVSATHAPLTGRLAALVAASAILLGACSSPASNGTPTPAASPAPSVTTSTVPLSDGSASPSAPSATGQAALLLEVHAEGGFINPAASIAALPIVAVDTLGRIYTPAAGGDAPLISRVDVRDTGPAGAVAILAAARAAGLADGTGGSVGVVGDIGTTVITLAANGLEVVTRVAANGPGGGPGGPGLPGGSPGASGGPGDAALALVARLSDPTATWGATSAPTALRLAPAGYRIWVAPADPAASSGATAAWPLAIDPAGFGAPAAATLGVAGLRSGVVAGADAATLASALGTAAAGTELTASGHPWRVWIRPLLPYELAG